MKTIIENFYKAFSKIDAEAMVQCYHEDIVFNDPAFGTLKGDKAKNM
ncbi:nuclear transport factor 2 family protein [uncultured Tenacibaculum sp.]|nr:nuclear transport factor 2 family protein [uncultured Tenacibaculum sp.]